LLLGFKDRKELDVGERRRVARVIGAPVLGKHGHHLGETLEDSAHFARRSLAVLERQRHGHRGADPVVALFERRQEFASEPGHQYSSHGQRQEAYADED